MTAGKHLYTLVMGFGAVVISGTILYILGTVAVLAYWVFPWSLLAVPVLALCYAVGRLL